MAPLFDTYIAVDWSATRKPNRGADSIWLGRVARLGGDLFHHDPENLPTRAAARERLVDLLCGEVRAGRSVVVGFDFPFGYPHAFAHALGLKSPPWRAVWDLLAELVEDGADNANNRFAVARELNRRLSNGRYPFWGLTNDQRDDRHLGARKPPPPADGAIPEYRLTDRWVTGPQPVWKLAYPGSVGSQALLGMPVVRALRDHPALAGHALVWPFETGLAPPAGRPTVVLAEAWPSLVPHDPKPGEVKDSAQVRALAQFFADSDASGRLRDMLQGPPGLTAVQRTKIVDAEAWILGLT